MTKTAAPAKEERSQAELIAIALILRIGGHDLHKDEIERAKTHSLVVTDAPNDLVDYVRVGAEPIVA
jgi:hypothetical protein